MRDCNDHDGFALLHDDRSDRRLVAALDQIISHLMIWLDFDDIIRKYTCHHPGQNEQLHYSIRE